MRYFVTCVKPLPAKSAITAPVLPAPVTPGSVRVFPVTFAISTLKVEVSDEEGAEPCCPLVFRESSVFPSYTRKVPPLPEKTAVPEVETGTT